MSAGMITPLPASRLIDGWQLASTPPSALAGPDDLHSGLAWIAANVPGTVAGAKSLAGLWTTAAPTRLDREDHWYRTTFRGSGRETLRFHGLATLATVWLNGRQILSSDSMFRRYDIVVDLEDDNELIICFRALAPALEKMAGGGRWRPRMIQPSSLRHVRTTPLGYMPGWCPPIHITGPWRAIERVSLSGNRVVGREVNARLDGTTGRLDVTLTLAGQVTGQTAELSCGGTTCAFRATGGNTLSASLEIANVVAWWPHTHGTPHLYSVAVMLGGLELDLGRVGFRTINLVTPTEAGDFGLLVNHEPVFCRGAVWATASIVEPPCERAGLISILTLARDAGMNMLRVPGTTFYEASAFYELCDELGLLVWQDFMFANFDYPSADPHFAENVKAEVGEFLERTHMSPCIAILAGGSEVYQQAAMMGLPQTNYLNPIFEQWLPDAVKKTRPDVPYVVGSPSGGALPFSVDSGPAHYFGVGGYRRPLDDARRANVAFASECLAFANVPEPYAASQGEAPLTGVSDPRWKSRVPRDVGSSWDFEDVRDYYLELLFGQHAGQLRAQDPERYLMLSRATPVAVMDAVFSEWTRKGSRTRGGLVLMLKDFVASAGWGLVSACGEPKSAWYGLKRLFKPLRVCMTDEGVNGLDLHVTNETATARHITLELSVVRDGKTLLLNVKRNIDLAPRSVQSISAYNMIGRFFDFSYAYRFQAPQHDATIARLIDPETGFVLCEVVHFPMGHTGPMSEAGVTASVQQTNGDWFLKLEASKLVRFLHIADPSFRAEDNWFHLAPFSPRLIQLVPRRANCGAPHGEIHALNLPSPISFEAHA